MVLDSLCYSRYVLTATVSCNVRLITQYSGRLTQIKKKGELHEHPNQKRKRVDITE